MHLHLHTFWLVLKTTEKFCLVVGRVKIDSFNFVSIRRVFLRCLDSITKDWPIKLVPKSITYANLSSPDKPIMVKLLVVSLIFLGIVECKLIFFSSLHVSISARVAIDFQTRWRISSALLSLTLFNQVS